MPLMACDMLADLRCANRSRSLLFVSGLFCMYQVSFDTCADLSISHPVLRMVKMFSPSRSQRFVSPSKGQTLRSEEAVRLSDDKVRS